MSTTLNSIGILYPDGTQSYTLNRFKKAIFGYGGLATFTSSVFSITNLINMNGGVGTDTTGVGTARYALGAASYGGDRVIFGYGKTGSGNATVVSLTNLVSNLGIVGGDVTGVGTARFAPASVGYGLDKAIFAFGTNTSGTTVDVSNLVSNTGVVANDVSNSGYANIRRAYSAGASYGFDKGFIDNSYVTGFGVMVFVDNLGIISATSPSVTVIKTSAGAACYGGDKAVFAYGSDASGATATAQFVSNTGVVANFGVTISGVGVRTALAAASYGGDKVIFGYGLGGSNLNSTCLMSNTGVFTADITGVGTARSYLAGAGYGS